MEIIAKMLINHPIGHLSQNGHASSGWVYNVKGALQSK